MDLDELERNGSLKLSLARYTSWGGRLPHRPVEIVSAVLGSIGLSNVRNGSEAFDFRASSKANYYSLHRLHGAFGHSAAFSLGSLPSNVIPNSLTTLSQYLRRIRSEFDAMG
ncbi:hypothetical protein FEM48_ZijujUnG0040200 [Ziziphus jujuba var. spinosa]|uniref:Uncharacterized protein n=1 Tax=Ziziphus jujuba var. spinosa TaxID=714518 RepID=A0A978U9B9_ZIZJJ|nr:hypothetical protein FEM48_ZijujUnG0040200 [Ziziphus jujuba var. spinosa]